MPETSPNAADFRIIDCMISELVFLIILWLVLCRICNSANDGVLQILYESLPDTVHIFFIPPRQISLSSPLSSLSKLLVPSPNALVIR